MKTWRRPLSVIAFMAVFMAVGGTFYLRSALAATGQMYLSPASASVQGGNNVTLSVRINPGVAVDGVQATVNFDTAKLQYVSADTSGSAFSVQLQQSQSGGAVTIARGDFSGGVSGDSLIENITFKALVSSGSSAVSLAAANASSGGNYTNPTATGATVNFTAPPTATCPSGQTGTPPNCVTPTPTSTPTPTPTPAAPKSSGSGSTSSGSSNSGSTPSSTAATTPAGGTPVTITEKKVQFTAAVISSVSKDPTQVYIKYGLDDTLSFNTPVTGFATTHEVALDPALLVPGETYSYVIVSTNKQGVVSQSAPQTLVTKGLKVSVALLDKNHKPLRNKTVVLHSTPITVKTDDKGYAVFDNVSPGTHHVAYADGKKTYEQAVQITNNVHAVGGVQVADTQNFSVVYGFEQHGNWLTSRWFMGTIVALLAAAATFLFIRRNVLFAGFGGPAPVTSDVVVVSATAQKEEAPVAMPPKPVDHLGNISYPNTPQPGHTIAPQGNDETAPRQDGKGL